MAEGRAEKTVTVTGDAFQRPIIFEDAEQKGPGKLSKKLRDNPFFALGMAGFFTTVLLGIRGFRSRPKYMSPSMYIVQFRVYAQGFAVSCFAAGVGYSIFKKKFVNKPDSDLEENGNS